MIFIDSSNVQHTQVLLISKGLASYYGLEDKNYIIECVDNRFEINLYKSSMSNLQECIENCRMLMEQYFYCGSGFPDSLLTYTDFRDITKRLFAKNGKTIKDAYTRYQYP